MQGNKKNPKLPDSPQGINAIMGARSAALRQTYADNRKKQVLYLIIGAALLLVLFIMRNVYCVQFLFPYIHNGFHLLTITANSIFLF
jgi:uncharacterized integral membrane protein